MTQVSKDPNATHPDHIGPYRLLRVLGEGGMGIVYEAEQRVTIRRKVAVKVMKPGLDTKEVIARFEAERQALAVMEHPGIAKVLDAGATEEGRPYFVMELVHGQPLRDYADARKLSIRERLELFVRVCQAVQHAHHKGVIHRDLKPSNILVEEREGTATPRVIDFGIAKATGQRLSEVTLVTQLGQALGTPAYMSPEQAEASGLDVDMRTDVYSLGVTLYELLVGRLPIDPAEVGPQDFMYQLLLRESDPPTPSNRYRTLEGAYRDAVAGFRGTDPTGLRKELAGDLDCIVMMALEKDRDRRYDTVNALALDLQRHLRHEPVWASSPNVMYRMRKFVRRHRVGVMAGAAVVAALLGGTVLATAGMLRARNAERVAEDEAAAAERVVAFLRSVFETSNPYVAPARMTAREILDNGAVRIRSGLDGQPAHQALLMNVIGTVYSDLGLYDDAAAMLARALQLREDLSPPRPQDIAESLHDLGVARSRQGHHAAAETLLTRALQMRETLSGPHDTAVASTLSALGASYWRARRFSEGEVLLERALAIWEAVLGAEGLDFASILNNLGNVYVGEGAHERAEPLLRRALRIREAALDPTHPLVATSLNNLATVYYKTDRVAEAAPLYQRALAIWGATLPPNHWHVHAVLSNLGRVYWRLGRLDEAEPLTRRALAILEREERVRPWDLSVELLNLADIYRDQGKYGDADPLYRRALRLLQDSLPEDSLILDALKSYATSVRRSGNVVAADSLDMLAATVSPSEGPAPDALPQ